VNCDECDAKGLLVKGSSSSRRRGSTTTIRDVAVGRDNSSASGDTRFGLDDDDCCSENGDGRPPVVL